MLTIYFIPKKALSDMDYEVRERHVLEVLFDMELWTKTPADRTIFYNGLNQFIVKS